MIRITDNGKVELDPIDITRDLALKTLIESEIKDEKTEKLLFTALLKEDFEAILDIRCSTDLSLLSSYDEHIEEKVLDDCITEYMKKYHFFNANRFDMAKYYIKDPIYSNINHLCVMDSYFMRPFHERKARYNSLCTTGIYKDGRAEIDDGIRHDFGIALILIASDAVDSYMQDIPIKKVKIVQRHIVEDVYYIQSQDKESVIAKYTDAQLEEIISKSSNVISHTTKEFTTYGHTTMETINKTERKKFVNIVNLEAEEKEETENE